MSTLQPKRYKLIGESRHADGDRRFSLTSQNTIVVDLCTSPRVLY